jgi:hypothetical protein
MSVEALLPICLPAYIPGNIRTDMLRYMTGPKKIFLVSSWLNCGEKPIDFSLLFQNMISFDVEHGSLTQLWAGTSPEGKDLNGKVSRVLFQSLEFSSDAFI